MPTLRWYQKLLPKTLWGQLVSLLLLAVLLAQAVALIVFVDTRRSLSNSTFEAQMIDHIVTVVNRIDETKSGRRQYRELLENASVYGLIFRMSPRPIRGADQRSLYSKHLKQALVSRFKDKNYKINVKSQGRSGKGTFIRRNIPQNIKISIRIRQGLWLNVERVSLPPPLAWMMPLLVTMVTMMLFIIIIISLVVRRLTKPLGALADAAQDLGRGRAVDELTETGAEDVRKVTRSFNQMNKKIKRFVDDRTKMLAAISHDLRTPLTSLRLRAEFIEDPEMKGKILETVEEMQLMTEAALKFSTDSASFEKTKDTDLESLLETLTDDYTDMGKQVKLHAAPDQEQIILPLRVQSIKRALRNLIDNGLKFGENVKINFTPDITNGSVDIFIRDQGEGIDEREFSQVFEPFYRLEKSRNKDTGGVGLGLSIARDIIRAHGGDIKLKNLKLDGKVIGLEVKISLPLD